jgi:hypothetical protein
MRFSGYDDKLIDKMVDALEKSAGNCSNHTSHIILYSKYGDLIDF